MQSRGYGNPRRSISGSSRWGWDPGAGVTMTNMSRTISALAVALLSAVPASAQVEQVAIKAGGLACGTCALVSEVNLRKLEGIEGVSISLSQEAVLVAYKPGALFRPQAILQVFEPLEVTIRQVQISARGRI